jgi:hypothetical protein
MISATKAKGLTAQGLVRIQREEKVQKDMCMSKTEEAITGATKKGLHATAVLVPSRFVPDVQTTLSSAGYQLVTSRDYFPDDKTEIYISWEGAKDE